MLLDHAAPQRPEVTAPSEAWEVSDAATLRKGPGGLGTERSRQREEQMPGLWGRVRPGENENGNAQNNKGSRRFPSGDEGEPSQKVRAAWRFMRGLERTDAPGTQKGKELRLLRNFTSLVKGNAPRHRAFVSNMSAQSFPFK